MHYFLFSLLGYLIGSFPTGVVLTRRKFGIDVREMGSGNIGATNVTRVFGWYAGGLVFAIDFVKGLVPLLLLRKYFPEDAWLLTLVGTALVLGHCFSAYLKFGGGKGVATSLGCLMAVVPVAALIAAGVYVLLLVTVKISAVGSLGGIIAALIYLAIVQPPWPAVTLVLAISFVVVLRHRSNIQRLTADLKNKKTKARSAG